VLPRWPRNVAQNSEKTRWVSFLKDIGEKRASAVMNHWPNDKSLEFLGYIQTVLVVCSWLENYRFGLNDAK